MTGNEVKRLCDRIGLSTHAMSMLLGVQVSTIYRWKACGARPTRMERLQREIILGLIGAVAGKSKRAARRIGRLIVAKLIGAPRIEALGYVLHVVIAPTLKP